MASDREAPEATRGAKVTIFVSDPSAEAEQIAASLRSHRYAVVDVPLAMLVARVAVQRPRIVIVDADADGAYAAVFRMRELPDAESIDVLFLGRSSEPTGESIDDAKSFFARPVDLALLVGRIETLTSEDVPAQPSIPAELGPKSVRPSTGLLPPPSMRASASAMPPPPSRASRNSQPPPSPGLMPRRSVSAGLSNELVALLADAEERAHAHAKLDSSAPSPEEEIEAVLPTELLAALDEPLEEPELEDEEPDPGRHTTSSGGRKVTTGASSRKDLESVPEDTDEALHRNQSSPTVPPRGRDSASVAIPGATPGPAIPALSPRPDSSVPPPATTASPAGIFAHTLNKEALAQVLSLGSGIDDSRSVEVPSDGPPRTSLGPTLAATGVASISPGSRPASMSPAKVVPLSLPHHGAHGGHANAIGVTFEADGGSGGGRGGGRGGGGGGSRTPRSLAPSGAPPSSMRATSAVGDEAVAGPGESLDTVARAIATRVSGSLSFEADGGLRRIILREGDLVTCASSLADESLLAFLETRGDLPKERGEALAGRVPPFGRHAGAALVAHGVLRQDQLWPVLRAHAEWILGRTLRIERGLFVREAEAPGRLKGEPSVFGGSTGAEVLIDVARRVIPADEAVARLGGPSATLTSGPNDALLVECALDEREMSAVRGSLGRRLEEVLAASGRDVAPLLYALAVVGVLDTVRTIATDGQGDRQPRADPLDEEAIVAKVQARLALVDDGDYFAILGVPHSATGYEVRRAFLDLRRTFEPARLLTPNLLHFSGDVKKIASVLEEAFDILRDDVRRERYRRAIEAHPAALE